MPKHTVYPANQPTIIIGPNSIRAIHNTHNSPQLNNSHIYPSLGCSLNSRGNRRLNNCYIGVSGTNQITYRGTPGETGYEFANEYDDEDEEGMRGAGYLNEFELYTWDLIIKNTPKLP